jgi:hypothetical protein
MKKAILSFGILSSVLMLIGVSLKIMHCPSASPVLIAGVLCFVLLYGLFYLVHQLKESVSGLQKAVSVFRFLSILLLFTGFLCNLVSCSGSVILLFSGAAAVAVYLILLFADGLKPKEAGNGFAQLNASILLLAVASIVISGYALRVDKGILNAYVSLEDPIYKTTYLNMDKTSDLLILIENNKEINKSCFEKAVAIKDSTDALVKYISGLEVTLVKAVDGEKAVAVVDSNRIDLIKIGNKDNSAKIAQVMIKEGKATELKNKLNDYKELILANTNSRGKESVNLLLQTNDSATAAKAKPITWESEKFEHLPVIHTITYLNILISQIRMVESETMNYLQFKSTKSEQGQEAK